MMKIKTTLIAILASIKSPKRQVYYTVLFCLILSPCASAHLMVAQQGTINFAQNGAYLVLSLPVSAFINIDDDGDGLMSNSEFSKYRANLVTMINQHVKLVENKNPRRLEGLILSPVQPHHDKNAPAKQIVIMGRFSTQRLDSDYEIHINLFGKKIEEQTLTINAKRSNIPGRNKVVLTPSQTYSRIFWKTT